MTAHSDMDRRAVGGDLLDPERGGEGRHFGARRTGERQYRDQPKDEALHGGLPRLRLLNLNPGRRPL
jgi:hypothetical protein